MVTDEYSLNVGHPVVMQVNLPINGGKGRKTIVVSQSFLRGERDEQSFFFLYFSKQIHNTCRFYLKLLSRYIICITFLMLRIMNNSLNHTFESPLTYLQFLLTFIDQLRDGIALATWLTFVLHFRFNRILRLSVEIFPNYQFLSIADLF